jgi:hypothetical protein
VFADVALPRDLDPRRHHEVLIDPSTELGGFVIKYSARGKLIWAKPTGTARIRLGAVGPDGSTYVEDESQRGGVVIGNMFEFDADLDPGPGEIG